MTLHLKMPSHNNNLSPRILVIGVGGAGGNIINSMIESSSEHDESEGVNNMAQILGNNPIPPKQIITALAVIIGLFLFFNLVSSLTEEEAKPLIEPKEEISVEPEGLEKIEPISISPNKTEKNIPLPAEQKESPGEDIKKKP